MDQGSGNGTRLNDAELKEEKQLKHGDILAFGNLVFEFNEPDMEQSDATVLQGATVANKAFDTEETLLTSSEEESANSPAIPMDSGPTNHPDNMESPDTAGWFDEMDSETDSTPDGPSAEKQDIPPDQENPPDGEEEPDHDMTLAEFDRLFADADPEDKEK